MIYFICGGVKNGKSDYAEDIACKLSVNNDRYYVATMIPFDDEDKKRIIKHVNNRSNKGFITIEQGVDISSIIDKTKNSTILIDSITALVMNEMFKYENKYNNDELLLKLENEFLELSKNVKDMVMVSDYIFSSYDLYSEYTLSYMELFGKLSCFLAKLSDVVIEVNLGNKTIWKGDRDV